VGRLPGDEVPRLGVTGPNLRASGIEFDVRKASPYEAYDEVKPKVVTAKEGDAYAGPPRHSPLKGKALHCVESARGELCFHIISTGGLHPYRVKIRGPTFDTILVMMPKLLKGVEIADIPVIYWSLDNCPADHDRLPRLPSRASYQ